MTTPRTPAPRQPTLVDEVDRLVEFTDTGVSPILQREVCETGAMPIMVDCVDQVVEFIDELS
ncbi:MAG: hypothetical protein L0Z62_02075 [Gemmataceae bacterium]|nr:hypothetical protein [Gemmataceae bacterium]